MVGAVKPDPANVGVARVVDHGQVGVEGESDAVWRRPVVVEAEAVQHLVAVEPDGAHQPVDLHSRLQGVTLEVSPSFIEMGTWQHCRKLPTYIGLDI